MKTARWVTLTLVAVLIGSALGAPAVARRIVDYARDSDRVDGFHAVGSGASAEKRAKALVATNKRGRLPNYLVRRVAKADNASKLDNFSAERIVKTCRGGALAGYAFVDGSIGAEFTEVEGFADLRIIGGPPPPPGTPEDGCSSYVPRARRAAAGTYEVVPYTTSLPCSATQVSEAVLLSVRDARPLTATYESRCSDGGLTYSIYVFDRDGNPVDADFTIALPKAATLLVP